MWLVAAFAVVVAMLAESRFYVFYPNLLRAEITVNGARCAECAVYLHRTRVGGIVIRNGEDKTESYSVGFPNDDLAIPNGAVWKCADGTFSFGPGFAFVFIHDYGPFPCAASELRGVEISSRRIEFTDAADRHIIAKW